MAIFWEWEGLFITVDLINSSKQANSISTLRTQINTLAMIKSCSIDVEKVTLKWKLPGNSCFYLRLPFLNLKLNDFLLWFYQWARGLIRLFPSRTWNSAISPGRSNRLAFLAWLRAQWNKRHMRCENAECRGRPM